jgi:hypothetical protein
MEFICHYFKLYGQRNPQDVINSTKLLSCFFYYLVKNERRLDSEDLPFFLLACTTLEYTEGNFAQFILIPIGTKGN